MPDSVLGTGALLIALALVALLRRAARRQGRCPICSEPRGFRMRAVGRGPRCGPCAAQWRYAAREGLDRAYWLGCAAAWDRALTGHPLRRRVELALFYAGLARKRAPQVGEEAAVLEAARLGAALATLRRNGETPDA